MSTDIAAARVASFLDKLYKFDGRTLSLRQMIESTAPQPGARLSFAPNGTFKREGTRYECPPVWTLWEPSGDRGWDVGQIGAVYAARLMGLDAGAIAAATAYGQALWRKERASADNKPFAETLPDAVPLTLTAGTFAPSGADTVEHG